MRREDFVASDGKHLCLAVWDEVENPRATVQILHGMAEHIARYDEFACFLNENGYIVVGDDHRAHGLTDENALGIATENLFERTVADERELSVFLKERYVLPVIVFGHSYGSFLTQRYLQYGDNGISAAVLCGSALMKGIAVTAGLTIAKAKYKKHADEKGSIFAKLTFEGYDKKIGEGKSSWLNRDSGAVEKYRSDKLCGYTCSVGFYRWFFEGLKSISKTKTVLASDFPLLIISGESDHVGGCGKLVNALAKSYEKQGLSPAVKLYPEARHEILNELNKSEVFSDVKVFLDGVIDAKGV